MLFMRRFWRRGIVKQGRQWNLTHFTYKYLQRALLFPLRIKKRKPSKVWTRRSIRPGKWGFPSPKCQLESPLKWEFRLRVRRCGVKNLTWRRRAWTVSESCSFILFISSHRTHVSSLVVRTPKDLAWWFSWMSSILVLRLRTTGARVCQGMTSLPAPKSDFRGEWNMVNERVKYSKY